MEEGAGQFCRIVLETLSGDGSNRTRAKGLDILQNLLEEANIDIGEEEPGT